MGKTRTHRRSQKQRGGLVNQRRAVERVAARQAAEDARREEIESQMFELEENWIPRVQSQIRAADTKIEDTLRRLREVRREKQELRLSLADFQSQVRELRRQLPQPQPL